jgi:hypothetical protein
VGGILNIGRKQSLQNVYVFIYLLDWMYPGMASSLWEELEEPQKMRLTRSLLLQLMLLVQDPIS